MSDVVEHCWLLDLDRTLLSVDSMMEAVEHLCIIMNLDYAMIAEEQRLIESSGRSFTVTDTIRSLCPERIDEFCKKLKQVDDIDCIYPDAREFVDKLKARSIPFSIITYSSDPLWQKAKLEFSGFGSDPYIICNIQEKSVLLENYLQDEIYELTTSSGLIRAKTVTLVDDKLAAFTQMPDGASSIYMNRSHKDSIVPTGIVEVSSFADILGEI